MFSFEEIENSFADEMVDGKLSSGDDAVDKRVSAFSVLFDMMRVPGDEEVTYKALVELAEECRRGNGWKVHTHPIPEKVQ